MGVYIYMDMYIYIWIYVYIYSSPLIIMIISLFMVIDSSPSFYWASLHRGSPITVAPSARPPRPRVGTF